jgi:multidrug efflux pump subunit AcrA (membrane-fusion protein)
MEIHGECKKKNRSLGWTYREYEYSLALAQRQEQENQQRLAYAEQLQRVEEQQRDRELQIAQLEAQLQDIHQQLAELSTVRSPYRGTIRRVKWLGQSDTRLTVEITLAIGSSPDGGWQLPSAGHQ